jgi:voltage-gated potassium channel
MKDAFDRHVYRILLSAALITVATGTIVFHISEKFSWIDAYYFSVVTLTTVGYGDIVVHTNFGKIFVTFYIFIGVGIITTFISYTMRRRADRMAKKRSKS